MSLIPSSWSMEDAFKEPKSHSLFDQHFGHGLAHEDLIQPRSHAICHPLTSGQFGPWRHLSRSLAPQLTRDITPYRPGVLDIHSDKKGFKVHLDVQQFGLGEITVKTVDNYVVVEGKHEETRDHHGFVSRHFKRRYLLPEGVDPKHVISTLSSDGVLTIVAPKDIPDTNENERKIPIIQTPALHLTHHTAASAGDAAPQDLH